MFRNLKVAREFVLLGILFSVPVALLLAEALNRWQRTLQGGSALKAAAYKPSPRGAAEKDTQRDGTDSGISTFNAMLSTGRTALIHEWTVRGVMVSRPLSL